MQVPGINPHQETNNSKQLPKSLRLIAETVVKHYYYCSMQIRDSLNHNTYIEHSQSILYAADENLALSKEYIESWKQETRVKTLGLIRSTMLLYSVSIELMLKARGLFEEREYILSGEITSFKAFLNRWNGNNNGHNYFKIIDHYKIDITEHDQAMLDNFKEYTGWAGRYPYPKDDKKVLLMENSGRNHGSIGIRFKNWAHDFCERQIIVMKNQ